MKKCDVIIPVYKSPEWVKLCVYALFQNTNMSALANVFLINDCDDEFTINCLNNLKEKYGKKITIITNKKNLGFVKSTNKGLKMSKAKYALLLNTDCLISKGTIEKLMTHMENNSEIGLICPISSNAANLTLEMFEGFSYSQMNELLESKFRGKLFDACTVVGNCLMISKECINDVGLLDESYGMGYGEETDYQFKALSKGFEAKVAIDTYVFHKSEASFGTSKEKKEKLQKNRELFFSRWGKEYTKEMDRYKKNDPIEYINSHLTNDDKKIFVDTLIYLNGIVQNAGGVHVVVDIVNYLVINGEKINILYDFMSEYKEIMLFNPIPSSNINNISSNQIVSTIYQTTFSAKKIADDKKMKLLSFVQGYETYFENASVYGIVETSYKLADFIFTISKYLQKDLKMVFNQEAYLIPNGINYDLIGKVNSNKKIKNITIILRNTAMKGDWILLDIIKKINNQFNNLNINVVYFNNYIEFPHITNETIVVNKILGPLSRNDIFKLLQSTDVYIDCSLSEGFGLTALEAMAAGCVPIVSNSKGITEYVENNVNGLIVNEVNDSDCYIEKLHSLIDSNELYCTLKKNAHQTAQSFDFDDTIKKYSELFCESKSKKQTKNKLTEKDKQIINSMNKKQGMQINNQRKIYKFARIMPKWLKTKLKKIISFWYYCFEH